MSVNALACNDGWNKFFSKPNKENFEPVLSMLDENPSCKNYLSESNNVVNTLLKLNSERNTYSLDLSVVALQYLGGGNKEDVMRSISTLLDSNAELFLRVTRRVSIESKDFESLVSMLPLSSVDNFTARIEILESRISNISNILYDDSSRVEKGISILTQYKTKLEKIGHRRK